ncbi:class 1 fructose-bisphosphatase [Candidatus Nitrosacidococcus sp. I8]|uniref:class 1 fructose-bisphosphatase n=1 Tax=Candidatus Nitrosacidococcus sp. I8 TaxID=2942908 RepID=UPI002225F464|nr:class 1 fructose-bisphosphatase [Candidatus Nitrosacidococcus sp. I8]CAH9013973.1 Fructose-1,6-bisphosphatase class 1 [Candidatus Nitrosacidococcus sp. I8]
MHNHISLNQFISQESIKHSSIDHDLAGLLNQVAVSCKKISNLVNRSGLMHILGAAGTENIQGEGQKKLDIISNDVMVKDLEWTGYLSGMVSEEVEEIISIPNQYPKGKYLLLFDPLDGSSNIDVNVSVGTIFSVLHTPNGVTHPKDENFLQLGTQQVCAGFCVYGPTTMLVLTTGHGVNGFTLDRDVGDFVLTHPNMTVPEDTSEFAINISNQRFWEAPIQRYIQECLQGKEGPRGKNFNMRWIASMVAEVYRILTRGGIFMYPKDHKDPSKPGRLRLMYEANPMSFIIEQAGGLSSTGYEPILTVKPTHIHQRIPVIIGSRNEVSQVISYHKG